MVRRSLASWRVEPDLTGLRDHDAVERLPSAEREACRNLWTEVDTLMKRAEGPG
jgi:hypothetical protein